MNQIDAQTIIHLLTPTHLSLEATTTTDNSNAGKSWLRVSEFGAGSRTVGISLVPCKRSECLQVFLSALSSPAGKGFGGAATPDGLMRYFQCR